MDQDINGKMNEFIEALKIKQDEDTDKMYKFLEALNFSGPQESSAEKKTKSNIKNKQIIPPSYKKLKKCNDYCIDCFLIFCQK